MGLLLASTMLKVIVAFAWVTAREEGSRVSPLADWVSPIGESLAVIAPD